MSQQEFTLPNEYQYNRSDPLKWIYSHLLRYKKVIIGSLVLLTVANILYAIINVLIGNAFNLVQNGTMSSLLPIVLSLLAFVISAGLMNIGAGYLGVILGQRVTSDARDEVFLHLLGKSQTFHNRQRIGDLTARVMNDVEQLSWMVAPGIYVIVESYGKLLIAFVFIAILNIQLLLTPILYMLCMLLVLRPFQRRLSSVTEKAREAFAETNAVLTEAVMGIETIKATVREQQEKQKFLEYASRYRKYSIQNGLVLGLYLPTLILGIFLILAFIHASFLFSQRSISLGVLIAFILLIVGPLRYVTEASLSDMSLIQGGITGSKRLLDVMQKEIVPDKDQRNHVAKIRGDVVFEQVSFDYGTKPVLKHISFHAEPGQTIAIVGQIGAGKSTMTKLINGIYEASEGHVLIDGVDVRHWDLSSLRSQIATIEQDIFLFSQTIAENIGYGLNQQVDQTAIEAAAKSAQAHDFIMSFRDGYKTPLAEKGVSLSGGQRQRIAIARALLTNSSIIIVDDATSAVDSVTEDEIQKSILNVINGRTSFLITNRLARIRQADKILVLQEGEIVDQGVHDELVLRCNIYRRIFSSVDENIPNSELFR